MEFESYFPIWDKLTSQQQEQISSSLISRTVSKGTVVHRGGVDCSGLLIVRNGQFRAYILSDEGREITIYRLFDRDICMLSASCIMPSIQFEITIEAEKDSEIWILPVFLYKRLVAESAPMANYNNELMATRLSDVMWLVEQIMWKSMDKRIAAFLVEETAIEGTDTLKITHETVANHLGTHREVVTRMLRYFQGEGMVKLSRSTVEITDREKLQALTDA